MSKHFYVYYSYEEFGRGYIGSRGCKCLPEDDYKYYGSFHDKTFNPTQKIILGVYESRKDAYEAEILLHEFYDVARNPHFANRSKQTSTKFTLAPGVRVYDKNFKDKISKIHKGKVLSEETKEKIRQANLGKSLSKETIEKMKESMKDYKHSEETKEKIRQANTGKVFTEEHRKNMSNSNANKGKKLPQTTREKIRKANSGKVFTEEHKDKIRQANVGKVLSEETKRKISESKKRAYQLKNSHQHHTTAENLFPEVTSSTRCG